MVDESLIQSCFAADVFRMQKSSFACDTQYVCSLDVVQFEDCRRVGTCGKLYCLGTSQFVVSRDGQVVITRFDVGKEKSTVNLAVRLVSLMFFANLAQYGSGITDGLITS